MLRRRPILWLLWLPMCIAGQCSPIQPGENLLEPRQWSQLQSDEQGTGFNGVHTSFAVPSLRKWQAYIGDMAFCSPVVDLQGNIWVGNVSGQLVCIAPNGSEKHRVYVGGTIVSSPAVDPDGRVFVLAQYPDGDSFRTILHEYDPVLGFASLNNPPRYKSTASPKIWGNYVFVPSNRTLLVFDRWTLNLVDEMTGCPTTVCGFFDPPEWVEFLGHVVGCLGTLFVSDLLDLIDCRGFNIAAGNGMVVEPSVAIVDNPTIVEDVNRPIILMATPQCLTAFDFDPTAAVHKLHIRWQQKLVVQDCDFDYLRVTTPAVLDGDQVVVGDDLGRVRSYHIDDGRFLWNYSGIPEPIQAPPVAGLRQIYVVTSNYLVVLDSNGREMSRVVLNGVGGGVSLSLDFAYVMTSEGIYSASLDPNSGDVLLRTFDDAILDGTHVGKTVPSIDRDGNIFLATPNGWLVAYGRSQQTISFRLPQISWNTPFDGQQIPYSAGQPLGVSLGNGGFTGDVLITSDIDGVLCEQQVTVAIEASCATANALTLGDHVLTVFATDEAGAQQAAQISVQAANSPPTVVITSPVDGAGLSSGVLISLVAQVGDAEESVIPDERIVWRSDVAGDLGTGASVDVMLGNGLHALTCTAMDEYGEATTASVSVTVTAPIP